MANELINPVAVSQDSLIRWENSLVAAKYVSRQFDPNFALPNEKIGYVYNARVAVRLRGRTGDEMQPESIRETVVPVAVNQLWGQDLQISDQDLTMTIDRFGERYVEPAVQIISNMIDTQILALYTDVYNFSGTPGVLPTSLTTYTDAGVVLADSAMPKGKMTSLIVNPRSEAAVLGFVNNIFNPPKTIGEQYLTGNMGEAVGFKWSMDQNIQRQVVGLVTGSTPIVTTANQSGNLILTSGWTAATQVLNIGDIVQFQGSDSVNPISYNDTGSLRSFVVTAPVVSSGGGLASIPISPNLNADPTNCFQTVTALPAAGAAIYVYGQGAAGLTNISGVTSAQNLAFHRDAFTLVIVKLELPGGMEWSEEVSNPRVGISIRLVRGYDIRSNQKLTRLDVLGGVKTIRPEFACRICSN